MIDISGIIEDDVEDEEMDTNTYDEETGELTVKIPRVFVPKRQVNIPIGEKCRMRIVENDDNIFFEKRVVSKVEGAEDSFRNDGYFGKIESLIKYVFDINVKEKLLHKKEIKDLEEIKDILRLSTVELKTMAQSIVDAMKGNEYMSEVANDVLERNDD